MSNKQRFLEYIRHYAAMRLDLVSAMLADNVTLRDWNISVSGKAAAVDETAKNFDSSERIDIEVLGTYESNETVAGELRILVDEHIELYVVDVITFDPSGMISAIRAYLGKGDN